MTCSCYCNALFISSRLNTQPHKGYLPVHESNRMDNDGQLIGRRKNISCCNHQITLGLGDISRTRLPTSSISDRYVATYALRRTLRQMKDELNKELERSYHGLRCCSGISLEGLGKQQNPGQDSCCKEKIRTLQLGESISHPQECFCMSNTQCEYYYSFGLRSISHISKENTAFSDLDLLRYSGGEHLLSWV